MLNLLLLLVIRVSCHCGNCHQVYLTITTEPEPVKKQEEEMAVDPAEFMPEPLGFVAFKGAGNRLDGKKRKDTGAAGKS